MRYTSFISIKLPNLSSQLLENGWVRLAQLVRIFSVCCLSVAMGFAIVSAQSASSATSDKPSITSYGPDFFAPKSPQTAFDMVGMLPGFTFSAGDPTRRGYASAAGNVIIDGERVSDKQFTLDEVLRHIPVDQVDHIEVIQGGKQGVEMLGQTIVANVVRKKVAGDKLVTTAAYGTFADRKQAPSGSVELTHHWSGQRTFSGAFAVTRYGELAEGNGPDINRDQTGQIANRASIESAAGGLTGYLYGTFSAPTWKGILTLNGSTVRTDYSYTEKDTGTFPAGSSTFVTEYLGGPLGGQMKNELGAHFSRGFGENWTNETVVLGDFGSQTYTSSRFSSAVDERFFQRQNVGEALARSNFRYAPKTHVSAEFSAEGAYNWLHGASTFSFNGFPIALPNANASVSEVRGQLSANLIWSPRKSVEVEVGARFENSVIASHADVHQSKSLNYGKPRLLVRLQPNSANQFRFRVEREVGQLNFVDFVASSSLSTGSVHSGNVNIVPEQDWVFEGSYEHHFWREADFVLTYQHFLLNNVYDRVSVFNPSKPSVLFDAAGNIGDGKKDALAVNLTVPLDRLRIKLAQLKVTGVRNWSHATDPTTGTPRSISGLQPVEYSVTFRQDLPRWRATWGWAFLTPCSTSPMTKGCTTTQYRFNEIDSYRATPTINVFGEFRLRKGLLLHLEGNNLLRQHYNRTISFYSGPRNAFPLSNTDQRGLTSFPYFTISLRKEF